MLLHSGLSAWLSANITQTVTSQAGAYVLGAVGDTLAIGFSAGSPGNADGALLATSDGLTLTAVYQPSEQGIHDFAVDGDFVDVPGTDPYEAWTFGNFYRWYIPGGVVTKTRTLTNVIHSLGTWVSGTVTFVGVGAHTGDSVTWLGQVFRSADDGATWATPMTLNDYRVYDVIGHPASADLYATGLTAAGGRVLYRSQDQGATWASVSGADPASKDRVMRFGNTIVGVQNSRTQLYLVAADGSVTLFALPFTITDWWNPLADGTDGYIYAIDTANRVWRSSDLTTWTCYAQVLGTVIALGAWPNKGVLVISTQGASAALYTVPLW